MDRYHLEILDALQKTFFSDPPSTTTATTRSPVQVLYPGCHRHITPSLIFSDVTYVDCDGKVGGVFGRNSVTQEWLDEHKQYDRETSIRFVCSTYQEMYHPNHDIQQNSHDLLISLSAGIVTDDGLKFLKPGGLYLVNSGHADAFVAFLSPEVKIRAYWDETTKTFCQDEGQLQDLFLARSKQQQNSSNGRSRKRSRGEDEDDNWSGELCDGRDRAIMWN